jgi:hypothetical protein
VLLPNCLHTMRHIRRRAKSCWSSLAGSWMAGVLNESPKFLAQQCGQGVQDGRANKQIAIVVQSSY